MLNVCRRTAHTFGHTREGFTRARGRPRVPAKWGPVVRRLAVRAMLPLALLAGVATQLRAEEPRPAATTDFAGLILHLSEDPDILQVRAVLSLTGPPLPRASSWPPPTSTYSPCARTEAR